MNESHNMTDAEGKRTPASVWQQKKDDAKKEAVAEGRTYYAARCNCYRGHDSSSGRCRGGQGSGFYTLPERSGICNSCWDDCGWAKAQSDKEEK